ncbi:hypothetical protein EYR36_010107 [Pleurotus pulmonarius]|nr:hypothetical protein EYR36_010107 [Pleurotus pulmonarius]
MSSLWRPAPLPTSLNEKINVEHSRRAYDLCLKLEKSTAEAKTVMHARVLGYLILYAPNDAAEAEVAKTIISCAANREELNQLGELFVNWFINTLRKSRARTPLAYKNPQKSTTTPRRKYGCYCYPTFQKELNSFSASQALIRDGYRCVISGVYDILAESQLPGISLEQLDAVGEVNTQRANQQVEPFNGVGVHSLVNIMTLARSVHDLFDRLQLWLEATETPHRYRIQSSRRTGAIVRRREFVTFTTSDPHRFPLPSPELLALHAACAKVANLSGAAEYLDKVDRDIEENGVLKENGDSSELLDVAIWRALGNRIDVGA